MSITYESPMKVKKEIPTGSVTCSNGIGSPTPRWCRTLSRLTANQPAYLNQPSSPSSAATVTISHARRDVGVRRAVDEPAAADRANRRYREQEDEAPVPPAVEHVARDEKKTRQRVGNGASSQLPTKTIPKKIAKSIAGKSTRPVLHTRSWPRWSVCSLRPPDDT